MTDHNKNAQKIRPVSEYVAQYVRVAMIYGWSRLTIMRELRYAFPEMSATERLNAVDVVCGTDYRGKK